MGAYSMDKVILVVILISLLVCLGLLRWRRIQRMWRAGKPALPVEKRRHL